MWHVETITLQNYSERCEALINKQINMEFHASYVYMAMVSSHYILTLMLLCSFQKCIVIMRQTDWVSWVPECRLLLIWKGLLVCMYSFCLSSSGSHLSPLLVTTCLYFTGLLLRARWCGIDGLRKVLQKGIGRGARTRNSLYGVPGKFCHDILFDFILICETYSWMTNSSSSPAERERGQDRVKTDWCSRQAELGLSCWGHAGCPRAGEDR